MAQQIDLHEFVKKQSPALPSRLVPVLTAGEQLEQFRETPGASPADLQTSEDWAVNTTREREQFGLDWARTRRQRNEEQGRSVAEEMQEDRNHSHALCQTAAAGLTDATELLREAKSMRDRSAKYERQIERIEESERLIEEIEADPERYYYEFYQRWPILAERVETLADHLYAKRATKQPGPRFER